MGHASGTVYYIEWSDAIDIPTLSCNTATQPPQPFGQLPRWGAKRIRRFSSSRKHLASPFGGSAEGNRGMLAVIEQCGIYRSAALSAPSGHLLHAGKAVCQGSPLLKRRRSRHLNPEP